MLHPEPMEDAEYLVFFIRKGRTPSQRPAYQHRYNNYGNQSLTSEITTEWENQTTHSARSQGPLNPTCILAERSTFLGRRLENKQELLKLKAGMFEMTKLVPGRVKK